jgi:hypothetical protein
MWEIILQNKKHINVFVCERENMISYVDEGDD